MVVNSLGIEMPDAIRVLIPCEVPGCDSVQTGYYTTCTKHTDLLRKFGMPVKYTNHNVWVYNSPIPLGDTVFDFRLSASYASRYNNCHGSANLEQALPGFEHPARNDNGMKGEGTRLHQMFEDIVNSGKNFSDAASCLEWLAKFFGPRRAELIQNEVAYITEYFLTFKKAPPVDWNHVQVLLQMVPSADAQGNPIMVQSNIPPRRIVFVAEALRKVQEIVDRLDPDTLEILVEVKVEAEWLTTRPKTTVDLIIRDHEESYVIDLKMGDIAVSPINNEQLMYYTQTHRRGNEKVTLVILQRNNIKEWELPMAVLDAWVEGVQQSERDILAGDLTLTAGTHCTFCPANPVGRGDKGNVFCPVMLQLTFGKRDEAQADEDVLEDIDV